MISSSYGSDHLDRLIMNDVVFPHMDRIELTDGLCRITFDPSTLEGLEFNPSGPNVKRIKDRSAEMPFASIGVEDLRIADLLDGTRLNERGNKHFLRLVENLDPSGWTLKGVNIRGRFRDGDGLLANGIGWLYVLLTNGEGAEAVCDFCDLKCGMCYVVSIYREGDDQKAHQILNLINSVHAK
jgi:hypothetical protein